MLAAALTTTAVAAARDFENPASHETSQQFGYGSVQRQDTPTDPDYDQSEPDTLNSKTSSNFYDERFDLFGFPSQLTPNANYAVGPNAGKPMVAGFNAAGAWKGERGRAGDAAAVRARFRRMGCAPACGVVPARGSRAAACGGALRRAGMRLQRARVSHACSSTHEPMATISPVSSARGMNSAGGTRPSSG